MAKKSPVFRKVSLERLSSPEQLDQLMQVTNPRGWLALAGFGALLLTALAWGVFGAIPTTAGGEGILIRSGGVTELVANGSGQVETVLVTVGQEVAEGEVVARIRQDALGRQIIDAQARLGDLRAETRELERYTEEQKRLSARDLAQQRANLERTIDTLERERGLLKERMAAERELLAGGLITKGTLLATEQSLNVATDQLAASRLERTGLELKRLEANQRLDQELEARRNGVRDLELEIRELEARRQEEVTIVSSHAGRVLELMVDGGDVVTPGTPILSLEVISEELMAVVFVPASAGKQVQPGMAVRVSPSTVKREAYGYILGEVTWVSEFPATSRGMERLLANAELVARLMEQGPPIQVNVALRRDPATPTGFAWSSSTGPDVEITSGTLTQGSVIVQQERPINLVIPKLRDNLGL
jgi:HlyD family secretion protein